MALDKTMTQNKSLREQASGVTNAVLALFALATVMYGLFDYNVYTQLLGFGEDQYRYLYVFFALLALSSLEQFARGGYKT